MIRSKGNVVLKTLSEWKLGRAAEGKLVLKKQEDNCHTNGKGGDC